MASYASNALLNRMADHATSTAMTVRIHTAIPGNSGTTSRIGTIEGNLAAASWGNASGSGDVSYDADVALGVIDSASNQTVTHVSIWEGSTFQWWADLSSATTVTAGGTLTITSGTIRLDGSSVSS